MSILKRFIPVVFLIALSIPQSFAGTARPWHADTIVSTDGTKTLTVGLTGKIMTSAAIVQEAPSGTINSSNVTFTLAFTPGTNSTVMLTLDGVVQIPTTDYSISSNTITMVVAPSTGQVLRAMYSKN